MIRQSSPLIANRLVAQHEPTPQGMCLRSNQNLQCNPSHSPPLSLANHSQTSCKYSTAPVHNIHSHVSRFGCQMLPALLLGARNYADSGTSPRCCSLPEKNHNHFYEPPPAAADDAVAVRLLAANEDQGLGSSEARHCGAAPPPPPLQTLLRAPTAYSLRKWPSTLGVVQNCVVGRRPHRRRQLRG